MDVFFVRDGPFGMIFFLIRLHNKSNLLSKTENENYQYIVLIQVARQQSDKLNINIKEHKDNERSMAFKKKLIHKTNSHAKLQDTSPHFVKCKLVLPIRISPSGATKM